MENSTKVIDTRLEIATAAGVSDNTIAKVEKIEANASEETKEKRLPTVAGAFCRNRNGREILDRKYYNILVAHLQQKPVHHKNEANRLPRPLTEKLYNIMIPQRTEPDKAWT